MTYKYPLLFVLLMTLSITIAQENTSPVNTLEGQFEEVIDKSNNYQEFKVIEKRKLAILQKNILDTVAGLESEILNKNETIATQRATISKLEGTLKDTNVNLAASMEKEDGIMLFGMLLNKNTYNTILWSIIGGLLLALFFFMYKFKNSNSITKEAKSKLAEVETEFEQHRAKKLEEIQLIRRKLQDEINKNRNVK